jgi:hypothetical protein
MGKMFLNMSELKEENEEWIDMQQVMGQNIHKKIVKSTLFFIRERILLKRKNPGVRKYTWRGHVYFLTPGFFLFKHPPDPCIYEKNKVLSTFRTFSRIS